MRPRKVNGSRIGDVLLDAGVITREQLQEALLAQAGGDHRPLGVILMALGYASAADVDFALMRKRAREGVLDHEEGLRLLDQAAEHTQQAMSCMEELTLAAHELAVKAKG